MTGPAGAPNAANTDRPLVDVEVLGPSSTTGFADGVPGRLTGRAAEAGLA
jgi:hypothetical protein